jgi:phage-related protein
MQFNEYKNYMIIDGVDSREFGLIPLILPRVTHPKKRSTLMQVNGRSGTLRVTNDDYDNVFKYVVLYFYGEDTEAALEYLSSAEEIIFSNEPAYKYLVADDTEAQIELQYGIEFEYPFYVNPLKREVDETSIALVSGQSIYNATNEPAYPSFDVTGTGDFEIVIGGQTINLSDVDAEMTIEGGDIFNCYDDAGNANNRMALTPATSIGFPVLASGESAMITFDCDTLTILPNWRWH